MKEIYLSVMYHNDQAEQPLRKLLADFEAEYSIKVHLRILHWGEAWSELIKVALYKEGPDVSEIGNTWASDLDRMAALRTFTGAEVHALGGEPAFLQSGWKSVLNLETGLVTSIPWVADTRLLYYRKDLLAEAGVDEDNAFHSNEQMIQTFEKLRAQGCQVPWVIPTHATRMTLHNAAAWVWGAGGRFLSEDAKRAMFAEPAALQGLSEYFNLRRYLAPEAQQLDDVASDNLFCTGKAAATVSGSWLLAQANFTPEIRSKTAFVSPPGLPYIGGSNLVIWKHCRQDEAAFKLVQFLNRPETQVIYCQVTGMLPTSLEALAQPYYSEHPVYRRLVERLKVGRSFRSVPLWGMIEDKLTSTLTAIWKDLLEQPELDTTQTLAEYLQPLARRLNITLSEH